MNQPSGEKMSVRIRNGFIWSLLENFSLSGIRFIIGVLMARMLVPSDYGMIGMLTVFMAVSDLLINGGLSSALNKMPQRTEKDFCTAFLFNLSIAFFLYGALFFCAPLIADFYRIPLLESLTRVFSLTLIINALSVIPMTKLQIELSFRTISVINLVVAIVNGIAGVSMAFNGYGVWALVYSTIIANSIRVLILLALVRWIPTGFFSYASFKSMFSYGGKLLLGLLVETLYSNIYPLVIGKVYSAEALGYYSRARGYADLPAATFTMMVYRVCFPAFCAQNSDREKMLVSYAGVMRKVAYIIFLVMILLLTLAKPLIVVVVTAKWLDSAPLLQILCLAALFLPVLEVNISLIKALGDASAVLKIQFVSKAAGVLVLALTLHYSVTVMCWGAAIISLLTAVVNFIWTRKVTGCSLRRLLKPFWIPLVSGAAMYVIAASAVSVTENPYLQCLFGSLAGVAAYVAVSLLMGFRFSSFGKNEPIHDND